MSVSALSHDLVQLEQMKYSRKIVTQYHVLFHGALHNAAQW